MSHLHGAHRACRAALAATMTTTLMLLSACGGGGGDGGNSTGNSTGTNTANNTANNTTTPTSLSGPASANGSVAGRTYWSWHQVPRFVIGPLGYGYYLFVFEYTFLTFFDNGLAYVGPVSDNPADMQCDAPRSTSSGTPLCVAYSLAGDQLTLGKEVKTLTAQADGTWKIGSDTYTPVRDTTGETLNKTYYITDCSYATCSRISYTFAANGRYARSDASTTVFTVPEVSTTTVAGGSDHTGRYQAERGSMVFYPDQGEPFRVFYFHDTSGKSDTIQLSQTWYDDTPP